MVSKNTEKTLKIMILIELGFYESQTVTKILQKPQKPPSEYGMVFKKYFDWYTIVAMVGH